MIYGPQFPKSEFQIPSPPANHLAWSATHVRLGTRMEYLRPGRSRCPAASENLCITTRAPALGRCRKGGRSPNGARFAEGETVRQTGNLAPLGLPQIC